MLGAACLLNNRPEFYFSHGITVAQGYGLTEAGGAAEPCSYASELDQSPDVRRPDHDAPIHSRP